MTKYFHIDNGGHTFKVDEFGNLIISTGFFGYSNTEIFLRNVNKDFLCDLAIFLIHADNEMKIKSLKNS